MHSYLIEVDYLLYIVGCRSDSRDNLILISPVVRNKTFDGVLKFYYYCKPEYIIIHFVKRIFLHNSRVDVFTSPLGCSPLISSHGVKN